MKHYLRDCVSSDPAVGELFIASPDLAETACSVRDRFTQAVLDMDESLVDVTECELIDALDNEGLKSLIATLGSGISGLGATTFPPRYHKIILVISTERIQWQVLEALSKYMCDVFQYARLYVPPTLPQDAESFERLIMNPETRVLQDITPIGSPASKLTQ